MEHTGKFQLSQWEAADRIQMQDFNADNAKIDAALAALTATLALRGNCQIETLFYTGTGTVGQANPTPIPFQKRPRFAIVMGGTSMILLSGERNFAMQFGKSTSSNGSLFLYFFPNFSWSGNTAWIWSSEAHLQMNQNNTEYMAIAFCAQDEEN